MRLNVETKKKLTICISERKRKYLVKPQKDQNVVTGNP